MPVPDTAGTGRGGYEATTQIPQCAAIWCVSSGFLQRDPAAGFTSTTAALLHLAAGCPDTLKTSFDSLQARRHKGTTAPRKTRALPFSTPLRFSRT